MPPTCTIAAISVELVKFDTQLMEHAETSGVDYQQGTLQGYEVREYLLEKWEITEFLKDDPVRLAHILAQLKRPLKDAAAVNATRWLLYERLKAQGIALETGSGGLTKYNRTTRHLPKAHWIDAACVGRSTPAALEVNKVLPLRITVTGHGCRQRCLMDKFGFPRTLPKQAKRVKGYWAIGRVISCVR